MRRGAVDKKAALAIGVASMVAAGATATYVTAAVPDKELRTRRVPTHSRSRTARIFGQKDWIDLRCEQATCWRRSWR